MSLTVKDGNGVNQTVDSDSSTGAHRQVVKLAPGATSTTTRTATSTTDASILAANTERLAATVYNDSTGNLYVNLGAAASATAFVIKLAAGDYWEVPGGYTGAVHGVLDAGTGNANVAEIV